MTDKEMDEILRCALTEKAEPDAALQRKVLGKWKEKDTMKTKKIWAAVLTAACILTIGIPVAAALHYMNSAQVAEHFAYNDIAKAFEGEDAIEINETQTVGGYKVTLLGITSGKNLEGRWNQEYETDGTYLVTAIEKEDGTPMPSTTEDEAGPFTVMPFISGFKPYIVNPLYGEGSFVTWTVINGVQYQLFGVGNLECFADHNLYVCVSRSITYNTEEYSYIEDETGSPYGSEKYLFGETGGRIERNEDFKDVNALFKIQLDASKADRTKAEEYLKQFEEMFN